MRIVLIMLLSSRRCLAPARLETEGFRASRRHGAEALTLARERPPAAVIVDIDERA